jgi:predicted small secreted protein
MKAMNKRKSILERIKRKFKRKESIYGTAIFYQQTWLDKQVQEAMFKRAYFLE